MCFSAGASFGAGVVLAAIGVATIKKARHPSQILFGSIPFLFGIQQICEGVLWVTLPNPEYLKTQKIFTSLYLIFAQVVWPIWVPIAILLLEKNATRKKIQKVFVGAGLIVGIGMAYFLLMYGAEAKIVGQHIAYIEDYPPYLRYYGLALYALATVVSPFFSHIRHMWMLSVTISISYIITAIFYQHYILSVWCFFASIISLSIYAITREVSKAERQSATTHG